MRTHGKRSTYAWGCRCALCRDAERAFGERRRRVAGFLLGCTFCIGVTTPRVATRSIYGSGPTSTTNAIVTRRGAGASERGECPYTPIRRPWRRERPTTTEVQSMRAVTTAAIAVAVLAGLATAATEASAEARQAHLLAAAPGDANRELREKTCRYQWLDPGTWTAREERRTTLCVLDHWPVPGGWETFDSVISCESGWYRLANNGGEYLGLAQHSATYWPSRVRAYMPTGWRVGPWTRWQSSRSQIVTTARMAHGSGWGAWTCAG